MVQELRAESPSASLMPTEIVPRRHRGRAVAAVLLLLVACALIYSMVTTRGYEWDVVGHYLFSSSVLAGVARTLILTIACMLIGMFLGTGIAVCNMSANPVLKAVSSIYIWFFRGTPLLVQLIFWYNLGALYPAVALGVPFGPDLFSVSTNSLISPWTAAIVGIGLNEGAYMSEIIRGGLLAVGKTQREAAEALGMSSGVLFRRIVLPQALRVIIPPAGNQFISLLKYTSLVSVIALPELLYSVQNIYTQTFQIIPLLIVCSLWYLAITTVLTIGQRRLEKHFNRGYGEASGRREKRGVGRSLSGTRDAREGGANV